jgi:hypothetical protein
LSRTGVITLAGSRDGGAEAAEAVDAEPIAVEPIETPSPGPLDAEAEVVDVDATELDDGSGPGNEAVRDEPIEDMDDGPQPGNERVPTGAAQPKPPQQDARRRPRRGGRYRPRREPVRAV